MKEGIATARGTTGLDGVDLKILGILAEWPRLLTVPSDKCDPADVVDILRDHVRDLCPLVGSDELWARVGGLVFSTSESIRVVSSKSSDSHGDGSSTSGAESGGDGSGEARTRLSQLALPRFSSSSSVESPTVRASTSAT